ncbi:MAG TPA: PBP1A family penicillin-binding protein [Sediminispirochaeta sp.]|nr:PBP1A family penicillin-binding protein [Sediminispirochaeta sp.]
MILSGKKKIYAEIIVAVAVLLTLTVGAVGGYTIAKLREPVVRKDLKEYSPAIPTQIYDRNGELITEIFSDVKRDIVPIQELPKQLIFALISREDSDFFQHNGFSIRGTARAAWNVLLGTYFSGGSTLTQQVAGQHYADRTKQTITRKLRELWYAFKMERELSKYEILEMYINEMYFGHNTYGVEAASQFYFGHSARKLTIAEAAILVIQLASPARYSPLNHPERARERQQQVLRQMVELGYTSQEEANFSFQQYWNNYNYSRSNIASAYFDNESKAPYFSEYVRLQLNDMLYGAVDINKDGYIVHTTLDLDAQRKADAIMDRAYRRINEQYHNNNRKRLDVVDETYLPIVELLSLGFNIEDIHISGAQQRKAALNYYFESISPSIEALSSLLGSNELYRLSQFSHGVTDERNRTNTVEGALITIDNSSGHIISMVGGSDFETKQYNRATDAFVLPGSSFKPLYYSEAISSGKFTPATRLYDGPIVFFDSTGREYTPLNYLGNWEGSVRLRYALATSMNVPSLQVLDGIGFEAAIDRASALLGMEDRKDNRTLFPRNFPLGLGITAVSPLRMARAFATFPNQGRAVEPMAITSVLNRNGETIINPEQDRIRNQRHGDGGKQVLSPQAAYVMVDLLQSTVDFGTLRYRRLNVGGFDGMPMAGKTGTTQNWGDAWTVGFSPYYTTAVWFGFDTPGNSLGRELTGATAAGPVWAEYMKSLHSGLPLKEFERPSSGLVEMKVCAESGQIPTQLCPETIEEIFIAGTEPKQFCSYHSFKEERDDELTRKLHNSLLIEDLDIEYHNTGSSFEDEILKNIESQLSEDGGDTNTSDLGAGDDDNRETYNPLLE